MEPTGGSARDGDPILLRWRKLKNSSRVKAKTAVVVGETSEGNGEKESV